MPLVNVELDTLKNWFTRLENGEAEAVTESIYDEIQIIEQRLKDGEDQLEKAKLEREKAIDAIKMEPFLEMKKVIAGNHYRVRSDINFKAPHDVLAGAEVVITEKGRTRVSMKIVEPNNKFFGKVFSKIQLSNLTNV